MPPRKGSVDRTGERLETPEVGEKSCTLCVTPDPLTRSLHQIQMARDGIEPLRVHLLQHIAQKQSYEERRTTVESVCTWLGTLATQWSGFVDERTGASMPWWQARQMTMDARRPLSLEALQVELERKKAAGELRQVGGAWMTWPPGPDGTIPWRDPSLPPREPGEEG